MALDEGQWWEADGPLPSRLLRYQLAAQAGGAMLRMETTMPGDLEYQADETQTVQIAMLPHQCRLIAQHLLQCADLLERHQRPLQ
jgi:hypothetical protein